MSSKIFNPRLHSHFTADTLGPQFCEPREFILVDAMDRVYFVGSHELVTLKLTASPEAKWETRSGLSDHGTLIMSISASCCRFFTRFEAQGLSNVLQWQGEQV